MNVYVPFVCLALGAAINWRGLPAPLLRAFDIATTTALMVLMVVIGLNIGTSPQVMSNLGTIGLKCLLISLCSIACSVLLVFIAALLNPRTDIVKIIDNEDFDYLCRTVRPLAILFKSFCSDCFDSGRGNFFYNERNYF